MLIVVPHVQYLGQAEEEADTVGRLSDSNLSFPVNKTRILEYDSYDMGILESMHS